jgi:hypothetical protein
MAKRPNEFLQQAVVMAYDHIEVTADTVVKLWKVPTGKTFRLDLVEYINVTGLAADNSNFFEVGIKNGSTLMAAWNTDGNGTTTGINGGATEGTIAADTFVSLTNSSTDTNLIAVAGDVLSLSLDETGTQTLPAGRVVIHGRYV